MDLPEKFAEQMVARLAHEYEDFVASLQDSPPTSIRLNLAKKSDPASEKQVPWCNSGFYLPERPVFTLDPHFHAGAYYVQEASSMFLEQAITQLADTSRSLRILDLCAAPGGKSTHLLSLVTRDSVVVCNDAIRSRATILEENVQKWGYPNAFVTSNDPVDFERLPGFFDIIVVDAPCSGEGLFRKDKDAIEEWSPNHVELCSGRQKRILSNVWKALAEGGLLIYCTCTYNEIENEENAQWMAESFNAEPLTIDIDPSWRVVETVGKNCYGYRFFPHRVSGEGFFLSAFRKTNTEVKSSSRTTGRIARPSQRHVDLVADWIQKSEERIFFQHEMLIGSTSVDISDYERLITNLRIISAGTSIATMRHDKPVPEHALALSIELNRGAFKEWAIGKDEALSYLRRDAIPVRGDSPKGFTLMSFEGSALGWANVLASRMNNLYPPAWRIRMR